MTFFEKNNLQNLMLVFMRMCQTRKNAQNPLDKPKFGTYNVPISRMDVKTSHFEEPSAETSSAIFQINQNEKWRYLWEGMKSFVWFSHLYR